MNSEDRDLTDWRQVKRLFTSSGRTARHSEWQYRRLAHCIEHGYIDWSSETYQRKNPSPSVLAERTIFKNAGRVPSTSYDHQLLKFNAWYWCYERYGEDPEFEYTGHHGNPIDVAAPKAKIWIECGDTRPRYVYEFYHPARRVENKRTPDGKEILDGFRHWNLFVLFPFGENRLFKFEPTQEGVEPLKGYAIWVTRWLWWKHSRHYTGPLNIPEPYNLGGDEPDFD